MDLGFRGADRVQRQEMDEGTAGEGYSESEMLVSLQIVGRMRGKSRLPRFWVLRRRKCAPLRNPEEENSVILPNFNFVKCETPLKLCTLCTAKQIR